MSSPEDNRWKRRFGAIYPLLVAIQFLTRIPVPRDLDPDVEDLADSVVWFPVVGLVVGGILAGMAFGLLRTPLVPAVGAAVIVVSGVVLTGAFHEDALGDALDGLIGGWSRDQILEIMRDSRVGTYGAVALASLLGLRAICLMGTEPALWPVALVVAHALARASTPAMLAALPYARGEGENPGVGRVLGPAQSVWRAVAGASVGAAAAVGLGGWTGLAAAAAAVPIAGVTALYYWRRVGGVTGDCLGATNVIIEVATLLTFALAHPAANSPWVAGS